VTLLKHHEEILEYLKGSNEKDILNGACKIKGGRCPGYVEKKHKLR
jgi:hypothetical protein